MNEYLLVFLSMYAMVGLRAFQQLNVTLDRRLWVMPTSLGLAVTEVAVIASVAHAGWGWVVVPVALGGGLGCLSAMALHKRMRR
jgi:CBS-domain-containing membrane protein